MADTVNEAELGRSKQSTTPSDHLIHLLTIGWPTDSPLVRRYVAENGLSSVLKDWMNKSEKR
ncbi:MAG: hypothetical protein KC777_07640 [Cyanobacteria bacterium HKST-UBA02]|nr:hypothetical protein [Cyanobacteria bacterium HKST-UBA02]